MAIGVFSIAVAGVCAAVALFGSLAGVEVPRGAEANYKRIYADMMPREVGEEML